MDTVLFNLHDVVLLITVFLCVFFSFFLFVIKRDALLSNLLLVGFLSCHAMIALAILTTFGAEFRNWAVNTLPHTFFLFELGYWLEGPMLLWYTRSILYKGFRLKLYDLAYLIPFFIFVFDQILRYYSVPEADRMKLIADQTLYARSGGIIALTMMREISRVLFGIWCLLELERHKSLIHQNYSNIDTINFNWLTFLVSGFLCIRIWSLIVVTSVDVSIKFDWAINFTVMGLIGNYSVMFLIATSIVLCARYANEIKGVDRNSLTDPNNVLTQVDEKQAWKIEKLFKEDKIYLNTGLTLSDLSNAAGISVRSVSTILNQYFKKRFFEFVNDYRIEEAKTLLRSNTHSHKSIMDIMYESGFNNKATFNLMFKKSTGVTPREYRKGKTAKKEFLKSGRWRPLESVE